MKVVRVVVVLGNLGSLGFFLYLAATVGGPSTLVDILAAALLFAIPTASLVTIWCSPLCGQSGEESTLTLTRRVIRAKLRQAAEGKERT